MPVTITIAGQNFIGSTLSDARRELAALQTEANRGTSGMRGMQTGAINLRSALAGLGASLSAIGIVQFGRDIVKTTIAMDSMKSTLTVAAGGAAGAARKLEFVRSEANRLGLDLMSTGQAFAQFAIAAKGTSLEGQGARDIFSGLAEASTVMGISAADTAGALRALQQMLSKGTVAAEELRGQLAERIPGSFAAVAKAMGVTQVELNKMLETGKVLAEDMLPKLGREWHRTFGPQAVEAAKKPRAEIERMKTAYTEFKVEAGGVLTPPVTVGLKGGSAMFRALTQDIKDTIDAAIFLKKLFITGFSPEEQEAQFRAFRRFAGTTTLGAGEPRRTRAGAGNTNVPIIPTPTLEAPAGPFIAQEPSAEELEKEGKLRVELLKLSGQRIEAIREEARQASFAAKSNIEKAAIVAKAEAEIRKEQAATADQILRGQASLARARGENIRAIELEKKADLEAAKARGDSVEQIKLISQIAEENIRQERRKSAEEALKIKEAQIEKARELARIELEQLTAFHQETIDTLNDEEGRRETLYLRQLQFQKQLATALEFIQEKIAALETPTGVLPTLEQLEALQELREQAAGLSEEITRKNTEVHETAARDSIDIWAGAQRAIANGFMNIMEGAKGFGNALQDFFHNLTRQIIQAFVDDFAREIVKAIKDALGKARGEGAGGIGSALGDLFKGGNLQKIASGIGGALSKIFNFLKGKIFAPPVSQQGPTFPGAPLPPEVGQGPSMPGAPLPPDIPPTGGGGLGMGLGMAATAIGQFIPGRAGKIISGAGTGAMIGSFLPIPGGPLIGAGIGALLGGLLGDSKKDPLRAAIRQWATQTLHPVFALVREEVGRLGRLGFRGLGPGEAFLSTFAGATTATIKAMGFGTAQEMVAQAQAWIERMRKLAQSLKDIVGSALSKAFSLATGESGFQQFLASVKTGLVDFIQKALIEGFIKGTVVTQAIAPFIEEAKKLTRQAAKGRITPGALEIGIGRLFEQALPQIMALEPLIGAMTAAMSRIEQTVSGRDRFLTIPAAALADIPSAQTGGLVRRGGLVNVHSGEQISQAGNKSITINAPITVTGTFATPLDTDQLASNLAWSLERRMKRVSL